MIQCKCGCGQLTPEVDKATPTYGISTKKLIEKEYA